jgi:hypothetical protein
LDAEASAIRQVTVIICRIGIRSHVTRVWSAGGVALRQSSGLRLRGRGNS